MKTKQNHTNAIGNGRVPCQPIFHDICSAVFSIKHCPASGTGVVKYSNVVIDSTDSYNQSTGAFTVPVTGG